MLEVQLSLAQAYIQCGDRNMLVIFSAITGRRSNAKPNQNACELIHRL